MKYGNSIIWTTALLLEGASSFVAPTRRSHLSAAAAAASAAGSSSKLLLLPEWMKGKAKKSTEPTVRVVVESTDEDYEPITAPTDVYASRLASTEKDNVVDDNVIDIKLVAESSSKTAPTFAQETDYDVVIVGAGSAGIGTALVLTKTFGLETSRVICIEQGEKVGTSFRQWPSEMRFISPSFNQQVRHISL